MKGSLAVCLFVVVGSCYTPSPAPPTQSQAQPPPSMPVEPPAHRFAQQPADGRVSAPPTDQGTCGASDRPCPHVVPPPPPPARGCAPLPSDRELASWSIDEICSPGSGPDPGDVRHVKDLPDGTHIVQNNGRCMRARYRECNTKCLPPDALIATPSGDVPIHDLRIGDEIWTRDPSGARVKTRVALVSRVEITGTHHIAQLVLADGRALAVSPEHPALDGQLVQSLRVGDTYDGASIVLLTLVSYAGARTHDVWPAGSTGVYWANGIPLTSTLRGI